MSKPEYLLWCDLETTGLDPEKDSILEIALVLTDIKLTEIGRFQRIYKPTVLNLKDISDNVINMHVDNGLWKDVLTDGVQYSDWEIETWLADLISPDGDPSIWDKKIKKIYLAGSSVQFDKSFLDKNFYFHRAFSHRMVDVSTVRTMLKMWCPQLLWEQNGTHRAMDDILDHIEELKHYKNILWLDDKRGEFSVKV